MGGVIPYSPSKRKVLAMINRQLAVVLTASLGLLAAAPSFAGSDTWKECSKETDKYCKTAKGDDAIFEGLEKREQMGKKKSGLASKCYKAHEAYEHRAGKTDENEAAEKHE